MDKLAQLALILGPQVLKTLQGRGYDTKLMYDNFANNEPEANNLDPKLVDNMMTAEQYQQDIDKTANGYFLGRGDNFPSDTSLTGPAEASFETLLDPNTPKDPNRTVPFLNIDKPLPDAPLGSVHNPKVEVPQEELLQNDDLAGLEEMINNNDTFKDMQNNNGLDLWRFTQSGMVPKELSEDIYNKGLLNDNFANLKVGPLLRGVAKGTALGLGTNLFSRIPMQDLLSNAASRNALLNAGESAGDLIALATKYGV